MRKLYENFHILHFQKRIVSAETIRGNTVAKEKYWAWKLAAFSTKIWKEFDSYLWTVKVNTCSDRMT